MTPHQDPERRAAEVRLTDETIDYLEERISAAVVDGLKATMTPDVAAQFWQTGFDVLKDQALRGTGDFVLGGLWGGIKKLLWVAGIALALWATGGLALVKGFLTLIFSK